MDENFIHSWMRYKPICFVFGNVAYSIGLTGGIFGKLKAFGRGEIKKLSEVFYQTYQLALERLVSQARENKANSVIGINATILHYSGVGEMLMKGAASFNPIFEPLKDMVTSHLTFQETWSLAKLGYAPMRILLGTAIFSLGFVDSITSVFKSFVQTEMTDLAKLILAARKNALQMINNEADSIGAEQVVGIKTYIYHLGNGLIEFLALGTAIKKIPGLKTESDQLPFQVLSSDKQHMR